MAGITVKTNVQFRSNLGRFAALQGRNAEGAARDMVETAADLAYENAPVGPARKDYGRREKLTSSIEGRMTGRTTGVVEADAGHAAAIESGAAPHEIPNAFGSGQTVMHPGNEPQPYIRPVLAQLQPYLPGILRKWFG